MVDLFAGLNGDKRKDNGENANEVSDDDEEGERDEVEFTLD